MSGEAAGTTAKCKMELSATFFTESPSPDSTGVLDTLLKNMLKLLRKLNETIKLYIK